MALARKIYLFCSVGKHTLAGKVIFALLPALKGKNLVKGKNLLSGVQILSVKSMVSQFSCDTVSIVYNQLLCL